MSSGRAYLDQFAGDPVAQRALLVCAAGLRLDDESAGEAIETITQANGRTRELLHVIKSLGCVWKKWDGSWYLAEEVRRELVGELYRCIPRDQISSLRSRLAEKAEHRATAMLPDGQITAHRLRADLIEAGYQRTLVPEQIEIGGHQLGAVWETATPSAGEATARAVDYLAPEIEERVGRLPAEVLFLRGMAARERGDRALQEKYFGAVWERGRTGHIFAVAAHFYGRLVKDRQIAESALHDSIAWNASPIHRGHVFHSLGNLLAKDWQRAGEAEAAYQRGLELLRDAPSQAQVWHSLGNLLAKDRQRTREAEQAYRKSLELDPGPAGRAQVWHSLGNLLTKNPARWRDAEEAFNRSAELHPDRQNKAHVAASLANLLSKYQDRLTDDRAENLALQSLQSDRGNPWTNGVCFRVLADVYERRRDFPRAIDALESLFETDRQLKRYEFLPRIRARIESLRSGKSEQSPSPRSETTSFEEEFDDPTLEQDAPKAARPPPSLAISPSGGAPSASSETQPDTARKRTPLEERIHLGIEKVLKEAWEAVPPDTAVEDRLKEAKRKASRIISGLSPHIRRDVGAYFDTHNWEPLNARDPRRP